MPPQAPRKTKQEKIDEILANLKDRVTTEEANLGEVLKDKKASRKQYPEAQGLLVDVSVTFNAVLTSLLHGGIYRNVAVCVLVAPSMTNLWSLSCESLYSLWMTIFMHLYVIDAKNEVSTKQGISYM